MHDMQDSDHNHDAKHHDGEREPDAQRPLKSCLPTPVADIWPHPHLAGHVIEIRVLTEAEAAATPLPGNVRRSAYAADTLASVCVCAGQGVTRVHADYVEVLPDDLQEPPDHTGDGRGGRPAQLALAEGAEFFRYYPNALSECVEIVRSASGELEERQRVLLSPFIPWEADQDVPAILRSITATASSADHADDRREQQT